jgi:ribosomal protein S18 acetylase RimI-like enzyme
VVDEPRDAVVATSHTVGAVSVTVRPARPEEFSAAGDLVLQAFLDDDLIEPHDPYCSQLEDAAGRARDSEVLVATEDGVLMGTVTWCPPPSSHREVARPGEGEIRALGVALRFRGRGVGERLVRSCLSRAGEAGLEAVALCTAERMGSAQRMYSRLGFVRTPARDWLPVPDLPLLAYRLDLRRC